jgi:hypothetical protein
MVKSVFNGVGYLLSDDTASGGARVEADMLGCYHCQRLMRRKLWADDGGFCHCCDGPICGKCADGMLTRGCENYMRQLEGALEDQYRRDQNARVLGT